MRKFNKTRAKRKLDGLFSKKIRSLGICQMNGYLIKCGGPLQTAHIENRANMRLRWDDKNVLCICFGHHFWSHHNPLQFVEFLLTYHKSKYDYVAAHRNEKVKFNELYYKDKLKELDI